MREMIQESHGFLDAYICTMLYVCMYVSCMDVFLPYHTMCVHGTVPTMVPYCTRFNFRGFKLLRLQILAILPYFRGCRVLVFDSSIRHLAQKFNPAKLKRIRYDVHTHKHIHIHIHIHTYRYSTYSTGTVHICNSQVLRV